MLRFNGLLCCRIIDSTIAMPAGAETTRLLQRVSHRGSVLIIYGAVLRPTCVASRTAPPRFVVAFASLFVCFLPWVFSALSYEYHTMFVCLYHFFLSPPPPAPVFSALLPHVYISLFCCEFHPPPFFRLSYHMCKLFLVPLPLSSVFGSLTIYVYISLFLVFFLPCFFPGFSAFLPYV